MPANSSLAPDPDPLRLGDPAVFRTIGGVTVLTPSEFAGFDPSALVENTNALARAGRPPSLQLGRTPLGKVPEYDLPPHVGFASQFAVGPGDKGVTASFHYLPNRFDEAMAYPRLAAQRDDWDDPEKHNIGAIALLKGPRGEVAGSARVCYSRELPAPSVPKSRRGGLIDQEDVNTAYRMAEELRIHPIKAYQRLMAGRLRDKAGRVLYARDQVAQAGSVGGLMTRPGLVEFATRHGITYPPEARLRYDEAKAAGKL